MGQRGGNSVHENPAGIPCLGRWLAEPAGTLGLSMEEVRREGNHRKVQSRANEAICRTTLETMDDDDTLEVESEFPAQSGVGPEEESPRNNTGNVKLRVDDLDEATGLGGLRYEFEKFGKVEEISLHMANAFNGESLVYALVTMPIEDARRAKRSLNASDSEFQEVTWPRRYHGPWFSPGWRPPR